MIFAIVTTILLGAALGVSLRTGRRDGLIEHHRYSNRYNDATGAREDHLG